MLDKDLIRLIIPGDNVLVQIRGPADKKTHSSELKKLILPLGKDVVFFLIRFDTIQRKRRTSLSWNSRRNRAQHSLSKESKLSNCQFLARSKRKTPMTASNSLFEFCARKGKTSKPNKNNQVLARKPTRMGTICPSSSNTPTQANTSHSCAKPSPRMKRTNPSSQGRSSKRREKEGGGWTQPTFPNYESSSVYIFDF